MRHDLIISHLLAIRSTVEALIAEVEEDQVGQKCCAEPKLVKTDTYSQTEIRCANCNTIQGGHVNGVGQTE